MGNESGNPNRRAAGNTPFAASDGEGGALLRIKAVPGASRSAIVGRLGDRLKVRIAAPAEGGKANRALLELLALELGVRPASLAVVAGQTSQEKTVHLVGVDPALLLDRW